MRICVLDDYQDVVKDLACFDLLSAHHVTVLNQTYSEPELIQRLKKVDALVLIRERTPITASLLEQLPDLKLISQTGKVSNHIDPALCEQYGVSVLEGRGSPIAPAELCWSLIMSATRHLPAYITHLQQGEWQTSGRLGLGRTLDGLTLGIWGYGKIGKRIAQYGKAFGMQVLVWGRDASLAQAKEDGFMAAPSKADFFRQADIISLHLRLNEATRACVTREDLKCMKQDSLFVNTSRAELVEAMALYDELVACPTKRAAIDVFEQEPASPAREPLLGLDNVTATPHLGYVEQNSYELYFRIAFENILAFERERQ